jgi:hypothetical protein
MFSTPEDQVEFNERDFSNSQASHGQSVRQFTKGVKDIHGPTASWLLPSLALFAGAHRSLGTHP